MQYAIILIFCWIFKKNNENILSLKGVVGFLKKYVEDLKDDGKGE